MVPVRDAEQFVPFTALPNWVKAATLYGFNIEPVFAELGVETDLIHVEEATITQPLLAQMMIACVERSSIRISAGSRHLSRDLPDTSRGCAGMRLGPRSGQPDDRYTDGR
jgi:hypothetical protein